MQAIDRPVTAKLKIFHAHFGIKTLTMLFTKLMLGFSDFFSRLRKRYSSKQKSLAFYSIMEPAYTALFKYSFVFLFTLIFSQAFANNTPHVPIFLEVQGRVADGSGKAITGASVQVKGTAIGTTTDDNGKFSLQADRGSILVVSHVGYQTREFPVTSEQPLLITLVNISGAMNEVIVIGYGTQKKK